MSTLLGDLRFSLRALARTPSFTAIAVLCIAVGIAVNVFVWSPFNALVVRPLPYRDSGHIMHLSFNQEESERRAFGSWSYPDYEDFARSVAERPDAFVETAAWRERSWNLGAIEEPERIRGAQVTASLFPLLGLRPTIGRFPQASEDRDGQVVVLGHALWQRKFASDSSVVGRAVTINGVAHTVIGVMQPGIRFPENQDIWLPIAPGPSADRREWRSYQVVARLAPGIPVEQGDAWISTFARAQAERFPDSNKGWFAWGQPLQEDVAGEVRPVFLVMIGAVAFVLLIACANVANLLLVRGSVRQREIAVRSAMGASRGRIVRQLLVESAVLAFVGGALGVVLGIWGVELFVLRMVPSEIPFWMRFDADRTVLLVSLALTVGTGIIFGLAPALQLSRPSLAETLKETGGRSASGHLRVGALRSSLVIGQLALSLVLLAGAMLMVKSFLATQTANLGFRKQGLLTFDLSLAGAQYANDTAYQTFLDAVQREIGGVSGVTDVAMASQIPVKSCCSWIGIHPEGTAYSPSEGPAALYNAVSSDYFTAMGITLREGRAFESSDVAGAPSVAIVNDVLAAQEWPGRSAIGQRFRNGPTDSVWTTVVGVVQSVVPRVVGQFERSAQVYYSIAQTRPRELSVVTRTRSDPNALIAPVRERMRTLDADLPLARVESMELTVRDRMFQPRVYGTMFAVFALTALVLASIGLYGVMSYVVAQRTHELGVRMALGATRRDIVSLVLRGGGRLVGIGLLIGIPAALALAQVLRTTLYGVSPSDLATFVTIPAVLAAVALLSAFLPARRASTVDPAVALRTD